MTLKIVFLVLIGFLLNACSVAGIREYDPYYKNTQALANVKDSFKDVAVKGGTPEYEKTLQKKDLGCRLTTFNMPANKTIAGYIEAAMTSELDAGKKLSPKGKSLSIQVNKLESDTAGMDKGRWALDFAYTMNGATKDVTTITEFESAFAAATACRNTAEALQQALRDNFLKYFSEIQRH
jgi:hypothetical protein